MSYCLGGISIFKKIGGDICNFVFIIGVYDTGDKLLSGTVPCFRFSKIPPAINFLRLTTVPAVPAAIVNCH